MDGVPGREHDPAGMVLAHYSSDYIQQFVAKHPIRWTDKALTAQGGAGDRAGRTPTPACGEWLSLLHKHGDLFTPQQYWDHLSIVWADWLKSKTNQDIKGLQAKALRNFHVPMLDQAQAYGLLVESGWFDTVTWDSYRDAVGGVDLTARRGSEEFRIALISPGKRATAARAYKITHRGQYAVSVLAVQMTFDRPVIGGKRWFTLSDFEKLRPVCVA